MFAGFELVFDNLKREIVQLLDRAVALVYRVVERLAGRLLEVEVGVEIVGLARVQNSERVAAKVARRGLVAILGRGCVGGGVA